MFLVFIPYKGEEEAAHGIGHSCDPYDVQYSSIFEALQSCSQNISCWFVSDQRNTRFEIHTCGFDAIVTSLGYPYAQLSYLYEKGYNIIIYDRFVLSI